MHPGTWISVDFGRAGHLDIGAGRVEEVQIRVVLAALFVLALEMRSLVLRHCVVGDRLLGPGRIFFQVIAAALLLNVDET